LLRRKTVENPNLAGNLHCCNKILNSHVFLLVLDNGDGGLPRPSDAAGPDGPCRGFGGGTTRLRITTTTDIVKETRPVKVQIDAIATHVCADPTLMYLDCQQH
jgi:hypothetical protein